MRAYLLILLFFVSCQKSIDPQFEESNFPVEVEKIIINKCATTGCHNDKSFQNAANLNLRSWSKMLQGGVGGSVVIPYFLDQSSLFQFVNTYSNLGLIATPTMPLNAPILSTDEVLIIKNWIENGCRNKSNELPFQQNYANRKKGYICNQGCDLVSVIDVETNLVIRYVKVGHDPIAIELPHAIKTSKDGKYWYVCFNAGSYFQKFDAQTDSLISETFIGTGNWNVIGMSPDDNTAYISDLASNGKLAVVNLQTMQIQTTIGGSGLLTSPHGIALTKTGDTIYVSAQYGNMIYRVIPSIPQIDKISIEKGKAPVTTPQLKDPHEIVMSPDFSKYFITCEASNEVVVMDAKTDTILKTIPVGIYPKAMAYSKNRNWLFVTCQEDNSILYPTLKVKGTVYVIDMNTLNVVKILDEKFYQPHGIAIDDRANKLFVVSRNAAPNGPAPHHASGCDGRNGFFHTIDLSTWKVIKRNSELSTDPYNMDIR
jgi:YVTN family beta-propeller protein